MLCVNARAWLSVLINYCYILALLPGVYSEAVISKETLFSNWRVTAREFCPGVVTYGDDASLAVVDDVVIDRRYVKGGNSALTLTDAVGQRDTDEYHTYDRGAFRLQCLPRFNSRIYHFLRKERRQYSFQDWFVTARNLFVTLENAFVKSDSALKDVQMVISEPTVLLTRIEYGNLYWTLSDFYNIYLTANFFGLDVRSINVLLLDEHPYGSLDPIWYQFRSVLRLRELPQVTQFTKAIFAFNRVTMSPLMMKSAEIIPLLNEYKQFLHSVHSKSYVERFNKNRCTDHSFKILFARRKDYISHPRNPSAVLDRKMVNEVDVINKARRTFRNATVIGLNFNELSFIDQLREISTTDILIGMHGAGLAYALVMPSGGALVELFDSRPTYWARNWNMFNLARWNNLTSVRWHNENLSLEDSYTKSTFVPARVVVHILNRAMRNICGSVGSFPEPVIPELTLEGQISQESQISHESYFINLDFNLDKYGSSAFCENNGYEIFFYVILFLFILIALLKRRYIMFPRFWNVWKR